MELAKVIYYVRAAAASKAKVTTTSGRRRRAKRGQDGWRHHQLNGMSLSKLQEMVKDREAWHPAVFMGLQRAGHDWGAEEQ